MADGFFRLLTETASVALVAADATGRIVCWNAAAELLLDAPADEMLGKDVSEVVPPERRALLMKILRRVEKTGQDRQFLVDRTGSDGKDHHLLVTLSVIEDADGQYRGLAAWIVDETDRKRMADRLAQAEKIASLGTLAGGVAHHFNNILGGVATFVDYALTSGDGVAMKRALQMTAEAAARTAKITQSLLSFAEHDTRRADLADLTEVVLTFSHLVERPLQDKHIVLNLDLQPVPVLAVEANRMHQVLGNLLTNAEEAMPNGGMVTIGLARDGGEIVLRFADTGIGIPAASLEHVFEPFFTTKGLLAGGDRANPGLGLSVVHGIVTDMGGTIHAESAPDRGAVFILRFPAPEDH